MKWLIALFLTVFIPAAEVAAQEVTRVCTEFRVFTRSQFSCARSGAGTQTIRDDGVKGT